MDKKLDHYVLGFSRRRSGAFEHAWNLARHLKSAGENTKYFSHWWDSPAKEINLDTEEEKRLGLRDLLDSQGVFHLQSHTWEHNGLVDMIDRDNSILVYGLHAIIPYYHLGEEEKKAFLKGDLPFSRVKDVLDNKISERERAQMSLIDKSDHILTISKSHKKILGLLGVEKPIHVLENVSEVLDLSSGSIERGYAFAESLKHSLDEENVIVYSGRLYPKKGSFGLLNAFGMIRELEPSSKLVLMGSGEEDIDTLERYGLRDEDKSKVVLVPWLNKSTREGMEMYLGYLLSSDVLIQPMITPELYSKSVIDAMSLGIPTITCESPYSIGSSEDADAIFDSFLEMKVNTSKTEEIKNRALEKVMRENNWKNYISNLEEIIRE